MSGTVLGMAATVAGSWVYLAVLFQLGKMAGRHGRRGCVPASHESIARRAPRM